MTVISKNVGRGDWLIHRVSDNSIGVHWTEDKRDGKGYTPVDLSKWSAALELVHGGQVVLRQSCKCDSFGMSTANIKASTLASSAWDVRTYGEWRIVGHGPSGETELLGNGNYIIE